ncbi:MAG: hypothetical protein V4561_07375 [Bacteroidota bacterium]
MKYKILVLKPEWEQDKKLSERYQTFNQLTRELEQKEVPEKIIAEINKGIEQQNNMEGNNRILLKSYRALQKRTVKLLEKELQLVTLHHYRTMWTLLGMSTLGIPLGLVYANIIDNMAMMSIGIPIGMGIGAYIGSQKDKKAFENGKQLNVQLKY